MWTNTAFSISMSQYDAVMTAEFEPARRREVLLGNLADTQCIVAIERTPRFGLASLALNALTAGRRLVRG
jgi:hypothetical protein